MTKREHDEVDIDFEPEEELGSAASLQAKLKKLKDELAAVKKERQEYLDGWQRAKADMANVRKDAAADALRAATRGKESLVEDILPALDAFDMAATSEAWNTIDTTWRSGMEQVRNQLLNAFSQHGIERFGKAGEQIDHALHEIVQESGDLPGDSGTIARILRHGYRMGERIIRPAHVIAKR